MAWIKRNLYFVIGSVVALALMGWAGYFLYSQWSLNNTVLASLNEDYEKLRSLNSQNPHPGSGEVDNIKEAKAQRDQLREFLKLPRVYFQRIAAIPAQPKVTDQDFTSALSHTLDQLQRDATNASVNIPANYGFSFEAQRPRVQFAAGSLPPLSVQLGEVKAIAMVLFQAKINWLDNLRRERVSADDSSGPQADYVPDKSVTNELAVMTPYEVTFRGFSSELAAVLSGFASSSNGFTIKTINVEPAPATDTTPAATPYSQYIPPTGQMQRPQEAAARYAQRYGINPGGPSGGDRYSGGGPANLGGIPLRGLGTPNPQPTYTPTYPTGVTPPATSGRGALPTVLDEKQLKVSMAIVVVKLLPPK